ncbi:hypothetical protein Hanom_Chr03g00213051 [Helianthus anomalus]
MHFWAYDETLGQVVIDRENLEVLAQNQIRATEKFVAIAKDWTSSVAGVLQISKNGFRRYKDKLECSGGGEGS